MITTRTSTGTSASTRVRRISLAAAAIALLSVGLMTPTLVAPAHAADPWTIDLRVDANRDGQVDITGATDTAAEDTPTALVLPNIDDDSNRCAEKDAKGKPLKDPALAACNDASDTVVNGPQDALDLELVRTVPQAGLPADTSASVAVSGTARVFLRNGESWEVVTDQTRLNATQLAQGVTLGVEASAPRSPKNDGTITVTLSASGAATTRTDSVSLTVAPLLTHHHLQAPEQVFVVKPFVDRAKGKKPKVDKWQVNFNRNLSKAVSAAGVAGGVQELPSEQWQQDYVEPLYATVPSATSPNGQQSMRVLLRSHQARPSQRSLYELRGADVGVLWLGKSKAYSSLNSFGNLETIPPYAGHPAGRIIVGERVRTGAKPSRVVNRFFETQGAGQDPILLDTSFLSVGHVDEFVQFLPADTERGWKIAIADPRAGLDMLRQAQQDGHGDVRTNPISKEAQKQRDDWLKKHPEDKDQFLKPMTVDQALQAGPKGLIQPNEFAARIIDKNLATLLRETGATDADVIRVPVLFDGVQVKAKKGPKKGEFVTWELGATVPDAVNNLVLGKSLVVAKQTGMRVDGRSVFADAVKAVYEGEGYSVRFLDDANYHAGGGDVHCGTNTLRAMTRLW